MTDPSSLIGAAEEFCLAENPDGLVCTEEPNHDGWHRAVLDGKTLDVWPAARMKWRVQRESFMPWDYFGDPAMPVWAAYPPARNRKPYLFSSWRSAIAYIEEAL